MEIAELRTDLERIGSPVTAKVQVCRPHSNHSSQAIDETVCIDLNDHAEASPGQTSAHATLTTPIPPAREVQLTSQLAQEQERMCVTLHSRSTVPTLCYCCGIVSVSSSGEGRRRFATDVTHMGVRSRVPLAQKRSM